MPKGGGTPLISTYVLYTKKELDKMQEIINNMSLVALLRYKRISNASHSARNFVSECCPDQWDSCVICGFPMQLMNAIDDRIIYRRHQEYEQKKGSSQP